MKQVYIFLAEGFEEIEAITPIDVLRRADIQVTTVSITNNHKVNGAHNIPVIADITYEKSDYSDADLVILPGGMPGTINLNEHEALKQLLVKLAKSQKLIGAICAAPMILGELELLKGKQATCYPGFQKHLKSAQYTASSSEVSDGIVTANGVGSALTFALELVSLIKGKKIASELATKMLYNF
ncbi:DJ-1/PfpI family protein [Labilibacter sediminis]|nr:DJ-1/PfpI family protein [Labilibacter sediminis]